MKNVRNRSKFREKWPFFAIILPWMASFGSETILLLIFCARDDLVKFYENRMLGNAETNRPLLTLTSWVKGTSPFVFKTFLALGSVVIVPFPRKCKWDDFEVLEYGSPHVFIFKLVGIFLSGGHFSHVVVPNYPVARVWTFWIKMSRLEIFL